MLTSFQRGNFGLEAPLAALLRLKAADFPEQCGHFPQQQRPKSLDGAAFRWKFRPKAARDTSPRRGEGA